jgi:hypothetical protein
MEKSLDSNDFSFFKKGFIVDFLLCNNLYNKTEYEDYISFLDDIYPQYKSHFNFLENIFYNNGTTFHKYQQIDTLQNLHLCLRIAIKILNNFDVIEIIQYIKDTLIDLAKGPIENEYIYDKEYSYMYYIITLEKILFSLSILFDYEEMQEIFKYIIYIFLPYFTFGYYFRDLVFKKQINKGKNFQINDKMNMNDLEKYLKDNNKQILNYFNTFLKKFALIKLLTDFNNKNEHIINSFNELSIENLLLLIEKDNLYKILPKNENNEINFIDIIKFLPRIFNNKEIFYKLFENNLDYNTVFQSIFKNIINYNNENIPIEKELIIQFSPIIFDFINLDNNIFDFIEKNLGKKCDICKKITKKSFICLICGNKICHSLYSMSHIFDHSEKCGGEYCLFIDMDNMKLIVWRSYSSHKNLYSLYINDSGNGPKGNEIGNEFNLSHERLNLAIKNYICDDFNFN